MNRVITTRASALSALRLRDLRKMGIRVLYTLISALAPQAWRTCQPTYPPTTMTTSATKIAADPTAPNPPCTVPVPTRSQRIAPGQGQYHYFPPIQWRAVDQSG